MNNQAKLINYLKLTGMYLGLWLSLVHYPKIKKTLCKSILFVFFACFVVEKEMET